MGTRRTPKAAPSPGAGIGVAIIVLGSAGVKPPPSGPTKARTRIHTSAESLGRRHAGRDDNDCELTEHPVHQWFPHTAIGTKTCQGEPPCIDT